MDGRFFIFLLRGMLAIAVVVSMTACGSRAANERADESESVIQPSVERREVKAPKIDNDNFEISAFVGLMSVEDFETNAV